MSRNSKNARLVREAKEMSKQRQNGNKGPAKTTPKHGKVNVAWKRPEVRQARQNVLMRVRNDLTVLEKLKGE